MGLAVQLMMGVSLAACAGLRAWLPMLVVGLLARGGYAQLHPSFSFLAREDALIVFGVATVLEFLGDKFVVVDHFLDAAGTLLRPAAGTVLASSMLSNLDPLAATVLGLIVGGGTSFTVQAGKAVARAKMSLFAPLHAGLGNAALSAVEDILSAIGLWLALHAPLLAFLITLLALIGAVWIVLKFIRTGKRLFTFLRGRRGIKLRPSDADRTVNTQRAKA